MMDYYMVLRHLHITAVALSGSLFLLRGLGIFAGAGWPNASSSRYRSGAVDTLLLVAGLLLTVIIQQYPCIQGWLTVQFLLLIVSRVLGVMAFREGRPRSFRIGFWVLAI